MNENRPPRTPGRLGGKHARLSGNASGRSSQRDARTHVKPFADKRANAKGPKKPMSAKLGPRSFSPPEPPSARRVAQNVLFRTVARGHPLEEALLSEENWRKLEGRDRAFAHAIVATALRRLGQIDNALARYVDRMPDGKDAYIRQVLRIAVAQLFFMDVPPHATVDEAAKMTRGQGMRAMVNAVLRRMIDDRHEWLPTQDAERLNLPDWLWRGWSEAYGEAAARAIVRTHLLEPPLDLTVRTGQDPAIWAERLKGRVLPTGSVRLPKSGHVPSMEGFARGAWWVQDAASALPARLLGNVEGLDVVDLAAAPGGKTLQLAAAGARVTAIDRSRERLERLFENLERAKLAADTYVADARYWCPKTPVDAVLLDTPCSATGTARRRPDVVWSKTPEAVASLTQAQDAILANAAAMVKPGGRLVYACCSLQPEEGPKRIKAFLRRHKDWQRQPVQLGEIAGVDDFRTADGDLRTLPNQWHEHGGLDGFYMARLVRRPLSQRPPEEPNNG